MLQILHLTLSIWVRVFNMKKSKVQKVMHEYKKGKLKSSAGYKVTNPKQALAIALSEAGLTRDKKRRG